MTAPAEVGAANEWARKDELMALPAETQLIVAMESVLAELKGLRADLAERSASVSSVELKQTSSTVALTVKKYADSQPPVDEAIEDFAFGMREIQRLQLANWAESVDALNGKPA